jgi:hypothetical protein
LKAEGPCQKVRGRLGVLVEEIRRDPSHAATLLACG